MELTKGEFVDWANRIFENYISVINHNLPEDKRNLAYYYAYPAAQRRYTFSELLELGADDKMLFVQQNILLMSVSTHQQVTSVILFRYFDAQQIHELEFPIDLLDSEVSSYSGFERQLKTY